MLTVRPRPIVVIWGVGIGLLRCAIDQISLDRWGSIERLPQVIDFICEI